MAPAKKNEPVELMVVNDTPGEECRIAIVQDNHLEELYSERSATATNVGNIYKGRVVNVEPAIQAAFIDFGEGQNGFLHISDLHPRYFPGQGKKERVGKKIPRRDRPLIQEALRRGDEVLVQVLKEGLGTKGPTLTSYLSIPGRLLVAMPEMDRVGVSRKIEDEEKRRQMRQILDSLNLPDGFGFILRTAGFDKTKTELKRDVAYLMRLWKVMEKRIKNVKAPCELYTESDLLIRTVRDVLRPSIQAVIVDSQSAYDRVCEFLRVVAPRSGPNVVRYTRPTPIFHAFDIERQIELIHSREVPLPSGGKLVIEQTEALVAIDVNSGKSRAARDSETNAFQTNCEAVDEICRQLRLRDLGGLIINDLIDMHAHRHRRQIEERFTNNLKRDRARTTVLRISDFGLVEMTRQRMRPSLRKSHFIPCQHCNGHGEIKSPESVGADTARHIGYLLQFDRVQRLEIVCSPRVASVLLSTKRRELVRLEDATQKRVDVRVSDAIAVDRVDFYAYDDRNADIDILQLSPPKVPTLKELEQSQPKASPPREAKKDAGKDKATSTHEMQASQDTEEEIGDDGEALKVGRRRSRRRRRRKKSRDGAPKIGRHDGADSQPAPPQKSADSKNDVAADGPMRIHVLAKELNVTSREVLDRCESDPQVDVNVKNHMSTVPAVVVDRIRDWFDGQTGEPSATASANDQATEDAIQKSSGRKKRRRRRGRGGRGGQTGGDAASAEKADTSTESKNERQPAKTPAQGATGESQTDEDAESGKRSRRSRRRRRSRRDGDDARPEASGGDKDASSKASADAGTGEANANGQATSPSSDREVRADDASTEAETKKKRRRRLYRNRSRVSPTARDAAERSVDE